MPVHYVELVSNDVDALVGMYRRTHGLSFSPPAPDLGQARVATLASQERPITRTYLAVDDIHQAVRQAEEAGAFTAYPPTRQGQRGTFAIVIQGGVQQGFWQR